MPDRSDRSDDRSKVADEEPLSIEEIIEAALQTKPLTTEEKRQLEEEYRKRERGKPGRKKG